MGIAIDGAMEEAIREVRREIEGEEEDWEWYEE